MTIEKFVKFIQFILDKEMAGWHSPEEICLSADLAQMDYFNECFADYGTSQKLHDHLSPFKAKYPFTNSDTPGGIITLPSTYQHLLNAYTVTFSNTTGQSLRKVQLINEDEYIDALNSQLRPVSASRPIGIMNGKGKIQLEPQVPQAGFCNYLRKPLAPVYNYTLVGRTITYNPTGSVDLEWNDTAINKVIYKTMEHLGVNLDDEKVVQYANMKASVN